MANREVLQHPKPFKKRSHRPWHSDLLEDTLAPLGVVAKKDKAIEYNELDEPEAVSTSTHSRSDTVTRSIPIVSDLNLGQSRPVTLPDKGRMLIGGFFKPEGLVCEAFDEILTVTEIERTLTTPTEATRGMSASAPVAPTIQPIDLQNKINQFNEHLETVTFQEVPTIASSATVTTPDESAQSTMVDFGNTEALLETIIKAKQNEVQRLSKRSLEQVKEAEARAQKAESLRLQEFKNRIGVEEKMRQVILQIQHYEEARVEEEKRRKQIEQEIVLIVQESEEIKTRAEEQCFNTELNLKNQEQARIAAEKLMEESLEKLANYEKLVQAAEELSEQAKYRTETFEQEVCQREVAERKCSELNRLLQESRDARQTLEEKYCNLTMEIDSEKKTLQLKTESIQQEIKDRTEKMQKIMESERGLRVILEGKLQKLLKKYMEVEKLRKMETAARIAAETKAKQALEQASKAVMHVLSVSGR